MDHRLPRFAAYIYFMDAGALISYSPNLQDHFHRVAILTDKVIKRAKSSEIPVEQPTKFGLLINLKTANRSA